MTNPDLSKLSSDDLRALASGRMDQVSEAGLRSLAGDDALSPREAWKKQIDVPFIDRFMNGVRESTAGMKQTVAHLNPSAKQEDVDQTDLDAQRAIDKANADAPQADPNAGLLAGAWQRFDGGRMAGRAAVDLGLTAPVLATLPVSGSGLLGMAGIGALSGLAGGISTPVDVGKSDYAGQRMAQIGYQTAGGAVLGPFLGKAAGAVGSGVNKLVNYLAGKISGGLSPQQLQVEIRALLQSNGVDFDKLGTEVQQYLTDQLSKAKVVGGTLDPKMTANAATLREAGIENPTRAQLTQSPTDFGNELFLRNQDGGRALANQHQDAVGSLFDKLQKVQDTLPPALDNPSAGRIVMAPLDAAQQRGQKLVGALYDQTANTPGFMSEIPSAPVARASNDFIAELKRYGGFDSLPKGLQRAVQARADGAPLTIMDVRDLLKQANALQAEESGAGQAAIEQFKTHLRGLLNEVENPAAQGAARNLETSIGAAADRFDALRKVPLMNDLAKATPTNPRPVVPDDVIPKYFQSGAEATQDNIANTLGFLQQTKGGAPAADQVRAQVLDGIVQKAVGAGGRFNTTSYRKALDSLQKDGTLEIYFTPEEIAKLRNVQDAAALLDGPSDVPRTGLLGAAKQQDFLMGLVKMLGTSKAPVVGTIAELGMKKAVNATLARRYQSAGLFTPDNLVPGLLRAGGASATPPLLNSIYQGIGSGSN